LWSNWFHLSDDLFKINDSNFKQIMTRERQKEGEIQRERKTERETDRKRERAERKTERFHKV
jgi:hypothetical protein